MVNTRLSLVRTGAKILKIGDLATASGTAVETIRYYEREGLMPAAARTSSNYRQYEERHLEQLRFIRHCRSLGMSLDEVRELLAVRNAPQTGCEVANRVLDEHIGHVSKRIHELRLLESQLKELRARCATEQQAKECGILTGLAEPALVEDAAGTLSTGTRHLADVHHTTRAASKP